MEVFRLEKVGRLAQVVVDDPRRSVNTLGSEAIADLDATLERLEQDPGLDGVILTSGKPGSFIVGADLQELAGLDGAEEAASWVRRGQRLLERWRSLPCPTVAAIRGPALGGGLEVALACTFRAAADDGATSLGLPEVRLGLIPALGGTWELPQKVGLERALPLLLTGRRLSAAAALELGLIDELVPAGELLAAAERLLASEPRRRQISLRERLLTGNSPGRALVLGAGRRRVRRQTGGHYPAPFEILDAVAAGLARGRQAALESEATAFGRLAASPVARNLVSLFLDSRAVAGGVGEAGGRKIEAKIVEVGIVGAGFMGSGIAVAAAQAGYEVRMTDHDAGALETALEHGGRRLADVERRGKLSRAEAAAAVSRLQGVTETGALAGADLVIEAVVEDLEVKREVFAALEESVSATTALGSNTSTLPIAGLAAGLEHPERFLGVHFFSPVHRMPLVELIRHPGTDPRVMERVRAFVVDLGKTPIVVEDGPGFFTTRILAPYLAEGGRLLAAGATVAEVDAAGRAAGFPVGPLELLDEVGIDVGARAAAVLAAAFPERMPAPRHLERLVAAGRLGRKAGRGFYDYSGRRKRPERLPAALFDVTPRRPAPPRDQMADRLRLAMAAEAVRCLEDGILERPLEGDVGAVLGLGFPPFLGGPFRFLDSLGADSAVRRLEELATHHGHAFEPPQLLRQQAIRGAGFYG